MGARQWIPLLSVTDDEENNNNDEIMTALADAVAIHEQHISNILLRGEITSEGVLSLLMFLPELFRDVPHDKSSLPRILKSLLLRVVSSQWLNEFQPSVRSNLLPSLEDRSANSFRDNLEILRAINTVKMLPSDDLDISAEMETLERAVQGLAYDADALDSHTRCTVLYVKESRRAHDLLVHMLRSNMLCVRGVSFHIHSLRGLTRVTNTTPLYPSLAILPFEYYVNT